MILSPGRRFAFVHIPKTGGTAFALAYEERARKDDILIGDTPKARQRRGRLAGAQTAGRLWKHSRLRDVEGLIVPAPWETWMVVTLVRNPWDRMVSYYHWLRDQDFAHPAVARAKALDFDSFVRDPATRRALHLNPYAAYVTDGAGGIQADHYLRLERLATDAEPVWDHLGFRLEMPHVNRSTRHADYRRYYTEDTAAIIGRLAATDIARGGYRFDPD